MACTLRKFTKINLNVGSSLCGSLRNGHHLRGKPPGVAKSLEDIMKEMDYKDPSLHFRVDIGLPPSGYRRSQQLQERLQHLKALRKNPNLEKIARENKLLINLEDTKREWLKTSGPYHIKKIADHYGVFQHLFGDAYFYPRIPLNIYYMVEDGDLPVYYGNIIKPSEASTKPKITYDSEENTLWTLILTNPDGHFTQPESEYVHWFVSNIPGNSIEKGETLVEYLQPFPPKGTGYHRHIFILYKQEKKIDLNPYKKEGACLNLEDRTFSTYDFYRKYQDEITPSGLAFFQSVWNPSLKTFYHNVLDMKEPIFEYDFEPHFLKNQKWFPLRQPFNLYMDRYRDPKQINKEFLMRKLKHVHPFKAPPPLLPYPNAIAFKSYAPSWLKLEIRKSKLKWGRINDIE